MKKFNAYHLSWLAEELRNAGLVTIDESDFYKWYNVINDGNHDKPQQDHMLFAAFAELTEITDSTLFPRLISLVEDYPDVNWVDALSRFQIRSKIIAYKTLVATEANFGDIWVMGGWIGVLPMLLLQSIKDDCYTSIASYDLDDTANKAGEMLVNSPRYRAECKDIYKLDYTYFSGTVINTICEHLVGFDSWQKSIPPGTLMLLQSNNMYGVDDHCNCIGSLDEFISQIRCREVIHSETSTFGDQYQRYTVLALK